MSNVQMLSNSSYYWSKVDLIRQKNILVIDVEQYGVINPSSNHDSSNSQIRKHRIVDIDKAKPFKCELCFYSSRKRNNLKAHMRTHSGVRPYKCDKCNFVSTHKSFLRKHKEFHATKQEIIILDDDKGTADTLVQSNMFKDHTACSDLKPFKCGMCLYSTRKKNNLVAHMRTHSGVKPYKSDQCGFFTTRKSALKNHSAEKCNSGDKTSVAKSNQGISCSKDCIIVPDVDDESTLRASNDSIFRVEYEKSETNMMCSDKTLLICNSCEYSSYDKDRFESHKRRWHDLDKPFKCEQCDYACKSKASLARHKRDHHMKKQFKCSQCDYESSRKGSLAIHALTVHSSSTPYKCALCPYVTKTIKNLKLHMRSRHSSDKPYKCKSCNYCTIDRSTLIVHNMVHTGERPYKCDGCSYAAANRKDLTIHTRIHTGEKPLNCPYCTEYTTGDPRNLNKHVKRIHGKVVKIKGFKVFIGSTS